MILQQNIPLYNFFVSTILLFFLAVSFIFTLSGRIESSLFFLSAFIAVGLFLFFRRLQLNIAAAGKSEFESKEEEINVLKENIDAKTKILQSLPYTCNKVSSLFSVSQNLIELIDYEEIFDLLSSSLRDMFPQADNILLFDFNKEKDLLSLIRSLKQKNLAIKDKRGDALDKWVLHHNISSLIEDITKDFRFDCNKVSAYKDRQIRSFVLSPISIEHKLLGIARIECRRVCAFSLDDLRLLRNICDLGAVVIEKAKLFSDTQNLAIRDSLTSFFVKDHFFERLSEECKRADSKKTKIGIVMLDIDDFKAINDTYGHIVGDFVLKKLARILNRIAGGPGNVISRFGGEEFLISIAESDKIKLSNLVEEIRKAVEDASLSFRRKRINFTVSLGAALYPDDGKDILKLIDMSDKLMYRAKKEGKNRACFSGQ